MKKLCAAITAALMLLCSPVTVCADNPETGSVLEPVQARYAYFRSTESNLTDNRDLTVTLSSAASGGSDTTKIEATQYLEKKVWWWWESVDDWSGSTNSNRLEMTNTADVVKGETYRARTKFTIYVNGDSESTEVISKEVTI